MIQLKNLERSYKTAAGQFFVLRRVNLEIQQGEFITIMGPSGAGKSSLLNVLALLDDAWEGEYWFREHAVHKCSAGPGTAGEDSFGHATSVCGPFPCVKGVVPLSSLEHATP